MKVKVESEKIGLKLNIQKTKIMASGPITSWEIDGETVETVTGKEQALLCPWDSPGKNTGVGCHALLQGIFLTQG